MCPVLWRHTKVAQFKLRRCEERRRLFDIDPILNRRSESLPHHFQFYRPKHFLDGPNCKTILSGKSYVLFPEKSYFKIQNINWWDGRWDWMKQQERGEKGQGGVVLHRRLWQSPPQPLRVILNFVYWIGWKTKAAHGGWLWVIFGEG